MSQWFSGDVIANNIKIHYHRTGGDKTPLVLSHGFTDNGLCWTRVARVLEKDYDVIMYDARGHGFSNAPQEGYSSEEHAADLAGLIQALELEKPRLIGHSMGATTVATTAANYPELVRCAILQDPPWQADVAAHTAEERAAMAEQWQADIIEWQSQTREEIMALCRTRHPSWAEVEYGPWADSKLQVRLDVFKGFALPRPPWQDIVPRIVCPILLVTGDPELGAIVTPEVAQEVTALWRKGKVSHIGGAGHNIRREQFEKYIEAVTAFLGEA
jgi:pimeloyl-ACP methyl ester carboxylesterase